MDFKFSVLAGKQELFSTVTRASLSPNIIEAGNGAVTVSVSSRSERLFHGSILGRYAFTSMPVERR